MSVQTAIPEPRSRGRILRWFFVVVLGVCGYGAWRQYDFRSASHQARTLGWDWECDDPIDLIRKDWKAAFQKATWFDGRRDLIVPDADAIGAHRALLERLAPRSMYVVDASGFRDLAAFKGLSSLQSLVMVDCTALTDVDGLRDLAGLRALGLHDCKALKNLEALKRLTNLQTLVFPRSDIPESTLAALKAALPNAAVTAE